MDNNVLTVATIKHLPPCVQKYLRYTKTVGKEKVKSAHIEQKGYLKIKKNWKKLKAKQYFNFIHKSFVWKATIGLVKVTDQFIDHKGLLQVKLFGLIPIVKETGAQIDQGEVIRLLSEMIWFPSSLSSHYIHWKEIDKNTAQAAITYQNKKAYADFNFDPDGKLISVTAKRYMENNGNYSLENWKASNFNYKEFSSGYIPYKGEVSWILNGKEECYCKIEITTINVNT